MSQRRIKPKKSSEGPLREGPLDWIRTDDKSIFECMYILLLTRGLYPLLEGLLNALEYEEEASRDQKAQFHPLWLENAEFCAEVHQGIYSLLFEIEEKWKRQNDEDVPNTARRKNPHIGGFYPLPSGGVYVPKH